VKERGLDAMKLENVKIDMERRSFVKLSAFTALALTLPFAESWAVVVNKLSPVF
jgi:hypothetical protein